MKFGLQTLTQELERKLEKQDPYQLSKLTI